MAGDIGACSALFNVTNTCCTGDFVHYVTNLVDTQVHANTQRRPPIFRAIQNLEQKEQNLTCGALTATNLQPVITQLDAALAPYLVLSSTNATTVRRALDSNSHGCDSGEKRKCADGTKVAVDPTTCNYPKCADGTCPIDSKICQNGDTVTRTGDNCTFSCPAPTQAQQNQNKLEAGPLQYFRQKLLQCQVQSTVAQRRFTLGQVCSLCVDPANSSLYFDTTDPANTKLIINQNAMNNYSQLIGNGLQCIN